MTIFSTASIRRTVISVTRNTHKLYVFSNVWDLYIWKNSVKEYSLFNSSIDIFNYVTRRVIFSFSIENCFWFHFRKYGISVWIPNSFKSPRHLSIFEPLQQHHRPLTNCVSLLRCSLKWH
jgi:hypothetical protein